MSDCIFCKIISGEIPSYKVYEDENYLAFLDIHPLNFGHTLLIPKKHYRWVTDIPDFGNYWETAKKISQAIQIAVNADFISFLTVGNEVSHAHIHIIPRFNNDGIIAIDHDKIKVADPEKMEEIKNLIINSINQ